MSIVCNTKNSSRSLIFLLLFFFLPGVTHAVSIQAGNATGVAPLYVNFVDNDSLQEPVGGVRPFHDYEYRWDFGDPSSGVWGTDGESKNEAKGPVAAHVYDQPGTYTVTLTTYDTDRSVLDADTYSVVVQDPDVVYAGTLTTCVNSSVDSDFTDCPSGANHVQTDDVTSLVGYADAGERILFKRGDEWNVPTLPAWPDSAGPLSFGAYGTCIARDAYGICANAPILRTPNSFFGMDHNQDYRIYDIRFEGSVLGGTMDMQRGLFYQLDIENSSNTPLGWSHWNDGTPLTIDLLAIVSCRVLDSEEHALYAGGERIAVIGNHFDDSGNSHLTRVWQAYKSVIQHNIYSHPNTNNLNGRLALKLHGPGYRPEGVWGAETLELCPLSQAGGCLENSTQYVVVSDNDFGGTAYQVSISPQDTVTDSHLSDIIFERNRIMAGFDQGNALTTTSLVVEAEEVTIRNNIFDTTGAAENVTGIHFMNGVAPDHTNNRVYNNTCYRSDASNDWNRFVVIDDMYSDISIINNLVSGPNITGPALVVSDNGLNTTETHNLVNLDTIFTDATNASVESRDFSLTSNAVDAIDQGYSLVTVFEDFTGNDRVGAYDIGAYNYTTGLPLADITPPIRSSLSPSGTLSSGTTQTTISLSTDESATCQYATSPSTAYGAGIAFTTTGGTSHSSLITGLSSGNNYTYYVRCQDGESNANSDDASISFSVVAVAPSGGGGGGGSSKDRTAPRKTSIKINDGDEQTDTRVVTLALTATDSSDPIEVQISEDVATLEDEMWIMFDDTITWVLSNGDGEKTVYIRFRDGKENTTDVLSDSIILIENPALKTTGPTGLATMTTGANKTGTTSRNTITTNSTYKFNNNLSMGMSGEAVTRLQEILRAEGVFTYPTNTGYFGQITLIAVKDYQKKYGISPTSGFVGPLTRAQLNTGASGTVGNNGNTEEISLEAFVRLLIAVGVIEEDKASKAMEAIKALQST